MLSLGIFLGLAGIAAQQYSFGVDHGTRGIVRLISLVVFFGLVAYLLSTSRMSQRWRYLGAAMGAGTVLAVGFSRLYLDVHWLSDVLAGFMLGLAYLLLTIWLVECVRYRRLRGAVVPLPPSDLAADAVHSLAGGHATTSA